MTQLATDHSLASSGPMRKTQAGVMDASYALDRNHKPELGFRMRSRAAVVAHAWRKHGTSGPPRLLEIGAAEGRTLAEIAQRIGEGEYVGIEIDQGLVNASESLPSNVRLDLGDALRLPAWLEDGSFDAVAMMAVLEHLPDPAEALSEAFRMLRPGGILVASCPSPFWDAVAGRLGLIRSAHHVFQFSLADLRRLVRFSGFEVLEAKRFMWAPIASLPYIGIPVSPLWALRLDACIHWLPLAGRLCVNGYVVARKPNPMSESQD